MKKQSITQARLKELVHYNPNTGVMTWKHKTRKLGWVCPSRGYKNVQIDNKGYRQHRLVFLYVTGKFPPDGVDHINHDVLDNRWDNLRLATQSVNNKNGGMRKDNKTGITGITTRNKDSKVLRVRIQVNGKEKYIGEYTDFFEACCARKSANNKYSYHLNHGD